MLILSANVFLYLDSAIKGQLFMKIYIQNLFFCSTSFQENGFFQNKYFHKTISGKMAFPLNYMRPIPQQSSGIRQPKHCS